MEISDVRIKLVDDPNNRLKAVCTITLDHEFVVRDLKVVEGGSGLFVAMPSRKLSIHCPECRQKNHLKARFCNECGARIPGSRSGGEGNGRFRLHRDIAHPISAAFREQLQQRVIERYHEELELAKRPDYQPVDIDQEYEEQEGEPETVEAPRKPARESRSGQSGYDYTDYDALIAELRSGATKSERQEVSDRASPQRGQDVQRGGPERRPAPTGRASQSDRPRGPKPSRGPGREQRGESRESVPTRRPHSGPPSRPSEPRTSEPVTPPRERSVGVEPTPPSGPESESDTPFGAGIF